jgi:hypothetical protein
LLLDLACEGALVFAEVLPGLAVDPGPLSVRAVRRLWKKFARTSFCGALPALPDGDVTGGLRGDRWPLTLL